MRSEFLAENLSSATSASLLAGRVARIHTSVPIEILGRYVIFRNLPCTDLGDRIRHIFDTVNRACLKNCPSSTSSFTLSRVRFRAIRESLIVAGLAGGIRSGVFRFMLLVHVLTEICYRPRASLRSFYTLSRQGAPFSRPSQLSTTKESSVIAR
jgi:ribosomal protein S14